jgi:multidrug efflux pump subunit AcrA (membrane-fusion protein)
MNNLIQAITDYTTALEQKMSALEARVAQLEEANEAMKREGDEAKALIAALQAEVATLVAAGVAAQATEPEVEIELIIDDSDLSDMPDVSDQSAEEPQEEAQEETLEPLKVLEPLEILDNVETEEALIEETMTETPVIEPVVEPIAEVKIEPAPAPKPAPRPVPQQTSLFGTTVEDIRQAISLGDRFLFQRELFAGNGELMQKTLDELNALGSLEEAMDYVADNFEWDSDSTAVQLFENVLKRRFA